MALLEMGQVSEPLNLHPCKGGHLNQAGLWRRMPGLLPETQLSPLVTQCAPWWQGAQARAPALRVALRAAHHGVDSPGPANL